MSDTDLQARAARLWPLSPELQRKWSAAVHMVSCTSRGWVLDQRRQA